MHQEALDGLLRALDGRMSAALIAPAGTGKTALLRRLVDRLPEARYQVRSIKVTGLSKRDLCREIATTCGVPSAGTYPALVGKLTERFETTLDDGGLRPVLVLDEAHELRPRCSRCSGCSPTSRWTAASSSASCSRASLPRHPAAPRRPGGHRATPRLLRHPAPLQRRGDPRLRRAPLRDRRRRPRSLRRRRGRRPVRDEPRQPRAIDALALEALGIAARAKATVVCAGHIVAARKVLWP